MAAKSVPALTSARLKSVVDYDPATGGFLWRMPTSKYARVKIGAVAGGKDSQGYIRLMIDGRRYGAQRLVWLYVHGVWPKDEVDHINGNRSDNRLSNLREATQSENQQNRRAACVDNKCGLLGASPNGNRWMAKISHSGRQHYLGSFATPELAHAAYLLAKRAHHPFGVC